MRGNKPLLLDNPQQVFLVQSGSLALFATRMNQGEAVGKRRYLFSVNAGEALFGSALWLEPEGNSKHGILAIAIEETQLQPLELDNIAAQVALANPEVISLLEGWIYHWSQFVAAMPIPKPGVLQVPELGKLSLPKGQALQGPSRGVIWAQVTQGSAAGMGMDRLTLDANVPVFALTSDIWLQALTDLTVQTLTLTELTKTQQLPSSLAQFHAFVCHYLHIRNQQEIETTLQQLQDRERLNLQVTEGALESLASAVALQAPPLSEEGTPLLIAAGAVGRAMGITIQPPLLSANPRQLREPVEAIALASQISTRRVTLVGDWWQEEHGPLLAFTQEGNDPVALLIDKRKNYRYVLFNPKLHTRTLVDGNVAASLKPDAYMFYRSLPPTIHKAREVFQFGVKGYETDIAKAIAVGILATLLGMATPQATAILINHAIPDGDRVLLVQIALGLLAFALGKTLLSLSQGFIALRITNGINTTLQTAVWDRLLKLNPSFIRQFSTGDLLVRIVAVSQIYSIISGATQQTLLNSLFSLLNLVLMFVYSPPLAWVGVGVTFVAVVLTLVSGTILLGKERQQEELGGEIQGLTVQLINGVSKLRVAAAEDRAFAAWAKKYSQQNQLNLEIIRIDDIVAVLNELLSLLSSVLVYWFGFAAIQAAQAGQEGINLGTFLAFNSAFGTFFGGVTSLSNTLIDILEIAPLWERTQPILQGQLESDLSKADPGQLMGQVVLDHVSFRYRDDGPLILNDISLHAEPGEYVAIVGPSGSGKSTIFRLLLGFETPQKGKVYYDGRDLASLEFQATRRQLGVVLQNGRLMQGSILDNITAGALVSIDEAWAALQMAGFAQEVEQMPMGINTLVSEGGTNLSKGQQQRLLIARALIFRPKIILLDEATSALDNRTQAIVTQSLERLKATRIVIAHRLSTIRYADRIYVMEAGRVLQVGSFEELVKQPGLFARLVARQL